MLALYCSSKKALELNFKSRELPHVRDRCSSTDCVRCLWKSNVYIYSLPLSFSRGDSTSKTRLFQSFTNAIDRSAKSKAQVISSGSQGKITNAVAFPLNLLARVTIYTCESSIFMLKQASAVSLPYICVQARLGTVHSRLIRHSDLRLLTLLLPPPP